MIYRGAEQLHLELPSAFGRELGGGFWGIGWMNWFGGCWGFGIGAGEWLRALKMVSMSWFVRLHDLEHCRLVTCSIPECSFPRLMLSLSTLRSNAPGSVSYITCPSIS